MSKFSGIDLHSNNSVVVVSDETDQVVYERRLSRRSTQLCADVNRAPGGGRDLVHLSVNVHSTSRCARSKCLRNRADNPN